MAATLLRGGDVVDGTGAARRRADVLVRDGRIVSVGEQSVAASSDEAGLRVVDVSGLVVAPGFIDMHAHSDLALLTDPRHEAKTTQGVTLEVVGQDGLSYAPTDDRVLAELKTQLAGWNGVPEDVDWGWHSVGGYLDRIDEGSPVNAAYLVPHGTLRLLCVGAENRLATEAELSAMCDALAEGLRQGAVGMSSGLTYTPGMYASTDELVALCRVVAAHGGYHAPHHRSYGRGALTAYQEMVDVAAASGCPVHLTHATMNFPVNAGRAPELIDIVDAALSQGVDVTLDTYPYLPGATTLAALLPSWAADGGPDELLRRLAVPGVRARITHDMEETGSDGCSGVPIDWAAIQVSGVREPANGAVVGSSIADAAAAAGQTPAEFCYDLLRADRLGTAILMHVGHEDNVRAIMRHPAHLVGSDGLLVGARPHPRAWGTFPRYLGHYVRDLGLLTLEECVARMTGRAARRLGVTDRGLVRPGLAADLTVFDPATVADRATFEQPRLAAAGIPYVVVNGQFVIDEGVRTDARPGRSVRRTGAVLPRPR